MFELERICESYDSTLLEAFGKKVTLNNLKEEEFLQYLKHKHKKKKAEIEKIKNAKEKDAEEIVKKYKFYYKKYKIDCAVIKYGAGTMYI
jgi:hypothetical protein